MHVTKKSRSVAIITFNRKKQEVNVYFLFLFTELLELSAACDEDVRRSVAASGENTS